MNKTNIKKNGYSLEESLQILKAYSISSYPETFTLTAILKPSNSGKKQKKINISDKIYLPHPMIKEHRILIISDSTSKAKIEEEFKNNHNITVKSDAYLEEVAKSPNLLENSNYDFCVVSNKLSSSIKKVESVLSKERILPTKKAGTLTSNVSQKVNEIIKKLTSYKTDRYNCIHLSIGTTSFTTEEIEANINAIMESVVRQKLNMSQKDQFSSKFYINSTMGPSLPINI